MPDAGYAFDGWVGTAVMNSSPSLFVGDAPITLTARFRPLAAPAYQPTGYEQWQLANYMEQQILGEGAAAADAPSGYAGMSNLALYAFGMSRYDGLTTRSGSPRPSLQSTPRTTPLADYTPSTAASTIALHPKTRTPLAVSVAERCRHRNRLTPWLLTNTLTLQLGYFEVLLPRDAPERTRRYFKLEPTCSKRMPAASPHAQMRRCL